MARVAAARAGARLAARGVKKATAKKKTAASQLKKKYGPGSGGSMSKTKKPAAVQRLEKEWAAADKASRASFRRTVAADMAGIVGMGGGAYANSQRIKRKKAAPKRQGRTTVSKRVNQPNRRSR